MRLKKFRIQNYRSIVDSGFVELSDNDNVSVFVGQNESGKSSLLKALYDFQRIGFEPDSKPFSTDREQQPQSVSCTYKIEQDDNIAEDLKNGVVAKYGIQVEDGQQIFDENELNKIKEFTVTRTVDGDKVRTTINEESFRVFQSSILNKQTKKIAEDEEDRAEAGKDEKIVEIARKIFGLEHPLEPETGKDEESAEIETADKEYTNIKEKHNSDVADFFWKCAPTIVFFDDFCDLLPDKIKVSELRDKKDKTEGYKAVRNLEKILRIDFVQKDTETDPVRKVNEETENKQLSVDFQKDWAQKIHGENKVTIEYDFQKREDNSYINFYVMTKEKQLLSPRQRSKGLIWFLSLWLELNARDAEYKDLVLLLDEPDQHLHVKAQEDILKLINKLSEEKQIFYATHSPYLVKTDSLSRIKLVLNDETNGTKIESITATSGVGHEHKKDALQPIRMAMGLNVSEFSDLAKKNVILEGISDFYYFSAMKTILKRSGEYAFIPGIGVRQISNLISMLIGYGLSWVVIIDDDPERGGRDSKKKFDEIKCHVFDGDEQKTKEKVHILDGIVGVENMFTMDDMKLIDSNLKQDDNIAKSVGKNRKVVFAGTFFEKVKKREITGKDISDETKGRFEKAFDFIDNNFTQ